MTKPFDDEAGTRVPDAGLAARAAGLLRQGLATLADLVVPPLCLACHCPLAGHDALCPECWRGIDFIRPPLCDTLGIPLPFDTGGKMISAAAAGEPPAYDRARAVARFDGVMRDLVHGFKFHDRHDAHRLFCRWLISAGADLIESAEVAVPVPLARYRLLRRQFNQAAILAKGLAQVGGLAYAPLALVRAKPTVPQVGLSRLQRRDNVSGAFVVAAREGSAIAGRNVLLIDDVITTGATADACAKALKRAGAKSVDVLALALVTNGAGVTT